MSLAALLLEIAASGSGAAAVGAVRPPRLVTGNESNLPTVQAGGPSAWLIVAATLVLLLTVSWWVWWGVRVYRLRTNAEERAFRRLSRAMGIRAGDRELLRRACMARGVHPIAAIGSPMVAKVALAETCDQGRRTRRLRRVLCDTEGADDGTTEAAFTGEGP